MKRFAVAMLAALSLTACGLEEGEFLLEDGTVVSSEEALRTGLLAGAADGGSAVSTALPTSQIVPLGFNPRALPQDPVPMRPPETPRGWLGTPDDP